MKKFLTALLLAALTLSVNVGCSGDSGKDKKDKPAAEKDKPAAEKKDK